MEFSQEFVHILFIASSAPVARDIVFSSSHLGSLGLTLIK
jgi:hypothetical protein